MVRTVIAATAQAAQGLCALALCAWFALHTSAFTSELRDTLDEETRPGVISLDRIEWGPAWGQATLYGLTLLDRAGRPLLTARRIFVDLAWDRFRHEEDRAFHLVTRALHVDDFELRLEWNRFRKLNLPYLFRKRTMVISRQKPGPRDLQLLLDGIELRNGTLHLVWPTFGFTFHGIDTAGSVAVRGEGEGALQIDVPALTAGASRVRIGRRDDLPMESIDIRDFHWEGSGFRAALDIAATFGAQPGGDRVLARGTMDFPEEGPTGLVVDASARLRSDSVRRLSGGRARGPADIELRTDGRDHLFAALKVAEIDTPRLTARDLDASCSLTLQDRAEAFWDFTDTLARPPERVAGWLRALPRRVEVHHLRAASLLGEADVALRDAAADIEVNVFSLSATARGTFADAPTALLRRWLPHQQELAGPLPPAVTGRFELELRAASPRDTRLTMTLDPAP